MKTLLLVTALLIADFAFSQSEKKPFKTIGGKTVFEIADKSLYVFEGGMFFSPKNSVSLVTRNGEVLIKMWCTFCSRGRVPAKF